MDSNCSWCGFGCVPRRLRGGRRHAALDCISLFSAESTASTVEAVSGFTQYATMEEAAAVMGFAMTVPDAVDGYSYQEIQANPENGIFEVVFYTEYNTEEAEGRGQELGSARGLVQRISAAITIPLLR